MEVVVTPQEGFAIKLAVKKLMPWFMAIMNNPKHSTEFEARTIREAFSQVKRLSIALRAAHTVNWTHISCELMTENCMVVTFDVDVCEEDYQAYRKLETELFQSLFTKTVVADTPLEISVWYAMRGYKSFLLDITSGNVVAWSTGRDSWVEVFATTEQMKHIEDERNGE